MISLYNVSSIPTQAKPLIMLTFYFYLLLYKFHDIFQWVSILCLSLTVLIYFVNVADYSDEPVNFKVKRFFVAGVVSLFMMTILPNQQESYILTGVYALKQGANSEIGQKMIQKLNQELQDAKNE